MSTTPADPAPVPATPDPANATLAADADTRWVPFTPTPANQILFAALVDGRPVTAILDTGASQSLLTGDFATRTGRKVEQRGRIVAIGGTVALGWTRVGSVAFGALTRSGGGLSVVALPGNVTGSAGTIDLVVGRDLLDRYALDIDYAGRRFRLLPSGRLPYAGTRAPLRIGRAPLAYVTELTVAGRKLRPVIVDTGDGTALTLASEAWRTLPLAQQPVMTTQLAYGVGGTVVANIGTLAALSLGERVVRDAPVWVERSGGFSDAARAAGRIGSSLLQRYRVLLDPGAGHMILADSGPTPLWPSSTSGLQLGLVGAQLKVLHVMRGSPAEATGWRIGDRIRAVDGQPVAADPAAAARSTWPLATLGTQVTLGLCDGTVRELTLRRFY